MPDDRPLPTPPDGEQVLSQDVYEHTVVEAFRNAPAAFAVILDPERSCIWIGSRGRPLDTDNQIDALMAAAYSLVDKFLSLPADHERPGHYRKGDA